jgi:hypothetical protein
MDRDILHAGRPAYLRPPPDPYLRKEKPIVNEAAPKEAGIGELILRGEQLLEELDKAHIRLHDATKEALAPNPQVWKLVKAAMTDYAASYAELIGISKRLNRLLNEEHPEMIQPQIPLKKEFFGDWIDD